MRFVGAGRPEPAWRDLDYRALKDRADAAEFAVAELRCVDRAQWRARQQAPIRIGRRLAAAILRLADLAPFWPFFELAPWVHVGKRATTGLGAMRVDPA